MGKWQWHHADALTYLRQSVDEFDLVIADPPYGEIGLIDDFIRLSRRRCRGATLVFMYPEDLCRLADAPERVLHWIKQPSTKNTSRTYSRFVEAIALYDAQSGPWNSSHWSIRTGVFMDTLIGETCHPHQKPVSLIEKLVHLHSNVGDSVLDPFGGSGVIGRTAAAMGRIATTLEIDQRLVNTYG